MMTIDLLKRLTDYARQFRADHDYFRRNAHMHSIKQDPPREVTDAVLTGFINFVAMTAGVDYGLYSSELAAKPAEPKEQADPQLGFTYDQVCAILCEACDKKLPSVLADRVGNPEFYHPMNGQRIPCLAQSWRISPRTRNINEPRPKTAEPTRPQVD